VLVVSEIALALLLLVGAGLMIRSSLRLQQVDPGFDAKKLLTLNIALPRQKYPPNQQALAFFDQLLARVAQLPGVDSVGGVDPLPMSGNDSTTGVLFEGQPILPMSERPDAGERVVTPDYFRALRVPLLEGRDFNEHDRADTPRVLVVNQALAQRFFPGQSAIGKRLGLEDENRLDWAEIVGVVGNVKHQRLDAETKPELYQPYSQNPRNFMSVVVRATGDPSSLVAPIRTQVAALDPDQPIYQISTMESLLARTLAQSRFVMLLLGGFSALAMVLAAVGIYGVMSWFVTQRNKEIGIRMALGAQQGDVLTMVVREGMLLAGIGVALGLAGSFALTRIIANLLYSVGPTDPATLAAVSILLTAVAFLACWVPARRAARVDPIITLRAE
jgi:putative ABC transport system permease protein